MKHSACLSWREEWCRSVLSCLSRPAGGRSQTHKRTLSWIMMTWMFSELKGSPLKRKELREQSRTSEDKHKPSEEENHHQHQRSKTGSSETFIKTTRRRAERRSDWMIYEFIFFILYTTYSAQMCYCYFQYICFLRKRKWQKSKSSEIKCFMLVLLFYQMCFCWMFTHPSFTVFRASSLNVSLVYWEKTQINETPLIPMASHILHACTCTCTRARLLLRHRHQEA